MPDIGSSSFNEVDANNDDASPDGFPEGMAPSGVNNSARAVMGAVKRFWNRSNAVKTTGGTSSAFTLTYDQAASAYYDGEIISFVVNAANAVDATINVNALGAKALRLFGGNLLAGAMQADQVVQARYNSSAGAFDIIPQNGWVRIGEQDPSAASAVDFTGIPAGVKHIMCEYELSLSSDGANVLLQTYGPDGVRDSGASDYEYQILALLSSAATSAGGSAGASSITLGTSVDNSVFGFGGHFKAQNIQAATNTKFEFKSTYLDFGGAVGITLLGGGARAEADRITGFRIASSVGTISNKVTLYGSG